VRSSRLNLRNCKHGYKFSNKAIKQIYSNLSILDNAKEMNLILQTELKKAFEDIKVIINLLDDSEIKKTDQTALELIEKGYVKAYDIIWNQLDSDRKLNVKGKDIKLRYKNFVLLKSKLKVNK
jgi:hypothetical protein